MLDDVVHSWESWVGSLRGARTMRRWSARAPALAGWTVDELRQPQSSARTDAMQAALIELSQEGESAAITTLLVQFRPALCSLAGWLRACDRRVSSFDAAAAEVRSTFCEVVMRHDLDRRPTKIAANIVLDTRQRLCRAIRREGAELLRLQGPEEPQAIDGLTADDSGDAGGVHDSAATLDLMANVANALDRLGGTDTSRRLTAELAYRAWFLEEPSDAVAAKLGLAGTAARTRLCRLRAAVRELQDEEVAAA